MNTSGLEAIEAIVSQPMPEYRAFRAHRLSPVIGAEIEGLDLTRPLSDETFAEVHQAMLNHQVLVFRDQDLSPEDHKAFGRRFGVLHAHALQKMREGDHERLEVAASRASKYVAGEGWHTDVSCDEEPPKLSMLFIDKIPDIGLGGDTLFANMYLAYEMLSPALRAFLDTLTAVHDGAIPWTSVYGFKPDQAFNSTEHPVVIRHPETGRKVLFVNRGFTSHIVQLNRNEGAALLEMLYRTIEMTPALTCRVRWTPRTMVLWDNRCTQHHALWDYYPLERHGFRVSVLGERPSR